MTDDLDGCAILPVVPEISRFHGISIRMFHREHMPPHLHAQLAEYEITVEIETCETHGRFPLPARSRVQEWVAMHRADLLECWRLARFGRPLPRIQPLE